MNLDYITTQEKEDLIKEIQNRIKVPAAPRLEDVAKLVIDKLHGSQVNWDDFKGVGKLMEVLKMGGFRGGGDTVVAGDNIDITPNSIGQKVISSTGGGGGSPASPNNSLQFNDDGDFGGSENLVWINDSTLLIQDAIGNMQLLGDGNGNFSIGVQGTDGNLRIDAVGTLTLAGEDNGADTAGSVDVHGGLGVTPGSVSISGGNTYTGDNDGGQVTLGGGSGLGMGNGGQVTINGGSSGDSAQGGVVLIRSGAASSSAATSGYVTIQGAQNDFDNGGGGAVNIFGGTATGSGSDGGAINITSGSSTTEGNGNHITLTAGNGAGDGGALGGNINLNAGTSISSGGGGNLDFEAGESGPDGGDGGYIVIESGIGHGGDSGEIDLFASYSDASGEQAFGGDVDISGGYADGGGGEVTISGGYTNESSSAGGGVYLEAGGASGTSSTNSKIQLLGQDGSTGNGGNINIVLGNSSGGGHRGRLNVSGLPTSAAGLASGDIWLNSNVLTIVP